MIQSFVSINLKILCSFVMATCNAPNFFQISKETAIIFWFMKIRGSSPYIRKIEKRMKKFEKNIVYITFQHINAFW